MNTSFFFHSFFWRKDNGTPCIVTKLCRDTMTRFGCPHYSLSHQLLYFMIGTMVKYAPAVTQISLCYISSWKKWAYFIYLHFSGQCVFDWRSFGVKGRFSLLLLLSLVNLYFYDFTYPSCQEHVFVNCTFRQAVFTSHWNIVFMALS